jgi:hypothetical protein
VNPGKWFNNLRINYNFNYSRRYKESAYQNLNMNVNANAQLKNLWFVGFFTSYTPSGNDFYEPREPGRVFRTSARKNFEFWIESNYAKKYSFGTNQNISFYKYFGGIRYSFAMYHNYRFNDHLSVGIEFIYQPSYNEAGYYSRYANPLTPAIKEILFSRRERHTVENIWKVKYNFNNKSGITFRTRHYWSKVDNHEFFDLKQDGMLTPTAYAQIDSVNQNFNAFTVDAVYTLQFAPGSFINIVWKNSIYTNTNETELNYFKNFNKTLSSDQNNSLSFKILYFLDYLDVRKKRK